MNISTVESTLKSFVIGDARDKLDSDSIERAIKAALHDLSHDVPRYCSAVLALQADKSEYLAPDDAIDFASSSWGLERHQYLGSGIVKRPNIDFKTDNEKKGFISFYPALNSGVLSQFGTSFDYQYLARHTLNETGSSINNESLFYTRAQAELMRELMSMNVVEPIQTHRGMSDTDLTGTPQYIYRQLMNDYRDRL